MTGGKRKKSRRDQVKSFGKEAHMDSKTAWKTFTDFYKLKNPSDEQVFLYTEAMKYIIETEKDPDVMLSLGGYYYEKKRFDLALRYYEMAASYDLDDAYQCLGYIWYYGRTGHVDYKKAYECFKRGYDKGNVASSYKIADMYKNGYYVEKDPEKYREIIEELYDRVKKDNVPWSHASDIFVRLAAIRADEGKKEEALELYLRAKILLRQQMSWYFFGQMNVMKNIVKAIHEMVGFDETDFDCFDLIEVFDKPMKVIFRHNHKRYEVESVKDEEGCSVRFVDKWYRSAEDFLERAEIDSKKIVEINMELYGFEVA